MDQNHNNGHNLKISIQNNSGRADSVSAGKDRRFSHEKNQETEIGEKSGNSQDQNRSKQKGIERVSIDGKQKSRNGKNNVSSGAYQSSKSAGGNGRFKNPPRGSGHNEALGKHTQAKRVETLEDIKADIERIDKEIQFEIKQIKAVKLGL
ncbi:MAG TPA: hypothetical protein GXX26_10065 [Clostridiaceae bacterium]|nr:hypothetical protein [Clostridiaceae bacterium]